MSPLRTRILAILLLPLLIGLAVVKGASIRKKEEVENTTSSSPPASPWLDRITSPRPRETGCWKRPWICNEGGKFPPIIKKLCCKNRCVDVTSDMNNCGLCGIKCPFTWQCCNGLCINTNVNPFHCGNCLKRCAFGSLCFYGMCGYAQPLPPFPFPLPPKLPLPPFPFPFPPKPPKPPKPFPPKPPKTFPPPTSS
ncbi:Stigma-specific protein Stig1 [Macleaya cordata]|uniref:Stigma-specific protein Stig1 n=1 Tax=Macleaya cordata TaxID=56857 RepID=A0A200RBB8_MACCD|nr:Stigma-specific protein Stig1 [Macleaya cordata]